MFGHHKMTHEGTARVVACQPIMSGIRQAGGSGFTFSTAESWNCDLILDVVPEGGTTFRAETSMRFGTAHTPQAGDRLQVRCNPEHKAVEIDISEDARFNRKLYHDAEVAERKEEHDRLLDAEPGTAAVPARPTMEEIKRIAAERQGKAG